MARLIARRLLAICLPVAAAAYVVRGFTVLVRTRADLHLNWIEVQRWIAGRNPYTDPPFEPSPYPPFSFPLNVVFYWPSWPAAVYYFAAVNLCCLAYLAWSAYRKADDPGAARTLAWAVPAVSAVSTGLGVGQNAVLYTTALVLALELHNQNRWTGAAAVPLSIAFAKFSLAVPFLLPFVVRRQWRVVGWTAALLVTATAVTSVRLSESPVTLLRQWVSSAERMACIGYGPATLLCDAGVPPRIAIRSCEAALLSLAALVMWRARDRSMLTLFGVAAGFARLWSYHRPYDNFVLVILLIALAREYFDHERGAVGAAALALGVTLWWPPPLNDVYVLQIVQVIVWSACIATLVFAPRPGVSSAKVPIRVTIS